MKERLHWLSLLVTSIMLTWLDLASHDWRIDVLSWAIVIMVWTEAAPAMPLRNLMRKAAHDDDND